MFNKNELVIDKVRSLSAHNLATNELLFRLTSLEDSNLQTTSEADEVVDAIGSVITTLYRAKKAKFTATNSLFSMNLAAAQFGSKPTIATETNKIEDYAYEILTVADGQVTLSRKAKEAIGFIYSIANNDIGKTYKEGSSATADTFLANYTGDKTVITVPEGVTGKIYVEYKFDNVNAMKVTNSATEFPESVGLVIYAYFRDKCNDNLVYSGKIICPKAKLNPEQVEIALTSTGKHSFDFNMMKDYCSEDGELFSIIVSE